MPVNGQCSEKFDVKWPWYYHRLTGGVRGKPWAWKAWMEQKGLSVNMKKIKFMISGSGPDILKDTGEFKVQWHPWQAVWRAWFCLLKMSMTGKMYWWLPCLRQACRQHVENELCYWCKMLGASGACGNAVTTRCCVALGRFRKMLTVPTSRHLSFNFHGRVLTWTGRYCLSVAVTSSQIVRTWNALVCIHTLCQRDESAW